MQLKELSVEVGLTLNLGNYESARINAGVVATVGLGDNEKEVYGVLSSMCEAEVQRQAKDISSEMAKRFAEKGK